MLAYHDTPIINVVHHQLYKAGVQLLIKREDLNHPLVSGNKWWKLKYNLVEAKENKISTLLTFGGAYSNHLYATAAAAYELGFKSIGIIRGEETLPLNNTLRFAKSRDMELHYVTREFYKQKTSIEFIEHLKSKFENFYSIPEGGTNTLAIKGCEEFGALINKQPFDYVCLPVGTGGTIAGVISTTSEDKQVLGFSSLKNSNFLYDEIVNLLNEKKNNWTLISSYHFGGYAKTTKALIDFIQAFEYETDILLDQVYTGKMVYGIFDLVKSGFFKRGTTVLAIHTGGLQGRNFL